MEINSSRRQDMAVITTVGLVHGLSHFFHLFIPPLLPWLLPEFGLSFTGLGASMTLFFLLSAIGQALAGGLVDRYGPRRVLQGGILCFLAASLTLAAAQNYVMLLFAAALAGLGNSVFHPADFTVLNRRVATERLSHAFSVHGLSGNLGWAAAPLFLTALAHALGWRMAALSCALLALSAVLLLEWRPVRQSLEVPSLPVSNSPLISHPLAFLSSPAVWLCFLFFLLITSAFGALQNFAPTVLEKLYGLPVAAAAAALSTYLAGGALGIFVGGFLARHHAQTRIIGMALTLAAALALVLAAQWVSPSLVPALMLLIGFCTGTAGPSRDLLVRQAATARFGQHAFGRVYGFVYAGLDLGLAVSPLAYGQLMDRGHYSGVLIGVAAFQILAIAAAQAVGRNQPPAHQAPTS